MNGREHRVFIFATSVFPLIGVLAAVVLLWNHGVGMSDLVAFAVMITVTGLGISVGYHRLLTHRSFETFRPLRVFFAIAGAMSAQGPPIIWAAHHRRHHRLADKPGDPHSPYANEEPGMRGALKGLWYSHLGWLFNEELTSDPVRYAPDLVRDRDLRFISKHFVAFVIAGMILPGLIGLALTGTLLGFATGVLWGGLIRLFAGNHTTYAVNSLGHYFGRRRFPTADESRNVAWLALASWGEAWHNNHHAFPRSASHGMRWYEVDISAMLIWTMEKLGLAWKVVRIDREILDKRAAGPAAGRRAAYAPPVPLAHRAKAATFTATDVE
ncbi:MAG TPA: acyl-CoA desaturase [Solirubrobacteraceae bacterium]|nr:acyl-CoA desaturase [Solirubrobacteraceae bacterium]